MIASCRHATALNHPDITLFSYTVWLFSIRLQEFFQFVQMTRKAVRLLSLLSIQTPYFSYLLLSAALPADIPRFCQAVPQPDHLSVRP